MSQLATTDRQILPNWEPGQDLPAGTNRNAITRWVDRLQDHLMPAEPKEIAVALKGLMEFMDGCGMYYKPDAATKIHCQALSGYPIWAIESAIKSIRLGWHDHKSPPYPADMVKALPNEYRELRAERDRLQAALLAFDAGKIAPAEDERASPEDMASLIKSLKRPA